MKVIIFIAILILGGLYLVILSPVFSIKNVDLSGDQPACASTDEIKNQSKVLGENILFIGSKKVEKNIKDKFLCIRSVSLQKSLSDVKLDLKNRRALLTLIPAVADESTESAKPKQINQGVLVDDEVVFAMDEGQSNQPAVYILDNDLTVGKRFDEDIVEKTVTVLEKLRSRGINSDEPIITSQNYLSLGQKPKIIFDLSDNLERQLASLQLILDQAKMDTKEVEFLDLRFDKPIVKYGQRPSNMRN